MVHNLIKVYLNSPHRGTAHQNSNKTAQQRQREAVHKGKIVSSEQASDLHT